LLVEHVGGIGPKLAMAVLGGMKVADFKNAVVNGDVAALSRLKGVGRKTAERMVLELKDKVGVTEVWKMAGAAAGSPVETAANDAVLALLALGYKQVEAVKAVRLAIAALETDGEAVELDPVIRRALRALH
jgi:holliday junction DNA helicase RuvA